MLAELKPIVEIPEDKAMDRRGFLQSTGIVAASLALPKAGRLWAESATSGGWRTFEVTTRVEVLKYSGTTRVWLPTALI